MDIALRVAAYVTMMHDGQKVVEGTPDEIRGNQMVHDIYLGSRFSHDVTHRCSQLEDVHAFYGSAHILEGVSFSMGTEAIAMIGRNGMGKSTLCNTIMGLGRRTRAARSAWPARSCAARRRTSSPPPASATCRRGAGSSSRSRSTSTCA